MALYLMVLKLAKTNSNNYMLIPNCNDSGVNLSIVVRAVSIVTARLVIQIDHFSKYCLVVSNCFLFFFIFPRIPKWSADKYFHRGGSTTNLWFSYGFVWFFIGVATTNQGWFNHQPEQHSVAELLEAVVERARERQRAIQLSRKQWFNMS